MLNSLFAIILEMSVAASFVIIFVLIARLLLIKAPKKFTYILWLVVLVRLLTPITFENTFSFLPENINNGSTLEESFNTYVGDVNIYHDNLPEFITAIENGIEPIANGDNGAYVVTASDGVSPPDTVLNTYLVPISYMWAIGVVIMSVISILNCNKIKKTLVGAVNIGANVYKADHIITPFVLGIFKPKIYLPSSLPNNETEFVLLHEKHHIKRLDHIIRILAFIALSIHWFNPLVWLAFSISGKDMEMSCDEAVMKNITRDIRVEYVQSLMRIATGKKFVFNSPLAFGEGDPKGRVKNVMLYKKPTFLISVVALTIVAVLGVGLLSSSSAQHNVDAALSIDLYTWRDIAGTTYYTLKDSTEETLNEDEIYGIPLVSQIEQIAYILSDLKTGAHISIKQVNEEDFTKEELIAIQEELSAQLEDALSEYSMSLSNVKLGASATKYGIPATIIEIDSENKTMLAKPIPNGSFLGDEVLIVAENTEFTDEEGVNISFDNFVVGGTVKVFTEELIGNSTYPTKLSIFSVEYKKFTDHDLLTLADKGEDLTWSDFDGYEYTQTGTDFIIRIYDINTKMALRIGGSQKNEKPSYIELYLKNENQDYIDFKTGDVETFISVRNILRLFPPD